MLDHMSGGPAWSRISVVTPSFNQGKYLEETIRSVLLQGYPDIEYIIIDGGSTDNSVEIIRKYSSWLHYWVSEPDRGQSHAINKGFFHATGDIFAYINSDDLYEPGALAVGSSRISRQQPLLVGDCLIFDENGIKHTFKAGWPEKLTYLLKPFGSPFAQPSSFWSRSIYELVGGFDEYLHYAFDREFFLKIGLNGITPMVINQPISRYRDHAATKTAQTIMFYKESIPIINKYAEQCGLNEADKNLLLKSCHDEIGYLNVFSTWKQKGRYAGLAEFFRLLVRSPWLLSQRKILGQFRRLLFFPEHDVAEVKNV